MIYDNILLREKYSPQSNVLGSGSSKTEGGNVEEEMPAFFI